MLALIICVALTAYLFICFKYFEQFKVHTFQAIVVNYFVCVVAGYFFSGMPLKQVVDRLDMQTTAMGCMLGFSFIFTFYLMAMVAQRISASISSVAGKVSLVIPVLVNVIFFHSDESLLNFFNILGIPFVLISIILCSMPKGDNTSFRSKNNVLLLLAVFILSGINDSCLNYTNLFLLKGDPVLEKAFPGFLFFCCGMIGVTVMIFRSVVYHFRFEKKSVVAGIALGIPNYFSIYCLFAALTDFDNNGALLFPIINVGVIVTTSVAALFLFKEHLDSKKRLGILAAIIGLALLAV